MSSKISSTKKKNIKNQKKSEKQDNSLVIPVTVVAVLVVLFGVFWTTFRKEKIDFKAVFEECEISVGYLKNNNNSGVRLSADGEEIEMDSLFFSSSALLRMIDISKSDNSDQYHTLSRGGTCIVNELGFFDEQFLSDFATWMDSGQGAWKKVYRGADGYKYVFEYRPDIEFEYDSPLIRGSYTNKGAFVIKRKGIL